MDLDDQLRSVYRMLWLLFADKRTTADGLRIELQRVRQLKRPLFRLERTAERVVDLGAGMYRDDCQYAITYYAPQSTDTFSGRSDTDKTFARIKAYLDNGGEDYSNLSAIQGWRFGWSFPQPLDLAPRTDVIGTIPAGTYQVRVSGVDPCGNESAASINTPIVVDAVQQNIYLRIPRVPNDHPLFRLYNVYVNGHLEVVVPMPQWGYPTVTLLNLVGTGAAPKEMVNPDGSLNTVRWKWIRVTQFSSNVREDLLNNGLWEGTITMETSVHQSRKKPQTDVIATIQATITEIGQPSTIDESNFVVKVG